MGWRPKLVSLHRDVGFFCVGLTVVYAVSGIAVNHREHWDFNYSTTRTTHRVGAPAALLGVDGDAPPPRQLARERQGELVSRLRERLGRTERPRAVFWRGPDRLSVFFGPGERDVVDYDPTTGQAEHQLKQDRPVIRDVNVLHLNERRGLWTYIADLFALALVFMAVTGILVVRGRLGLRGRGGWLLAAGVAVPLLGLLVRC